MAKYVKLPVLMSRENERTEFAPRLLMVYTTLVGMVGPATPLHCRASFVDFVPLLLTVDLTALLFAREAEARSGPQTRARAAVMMLRESFISNEEW